MKYLIVLFRLSFSLEPITALIIIPGTNVTTFAVHPGAVATELVRFKDNLFFPIRLLINILYHGVMKHCIKSPVSGAQTSLYCAVETDIENLSGKYFRYMKHLMYTGDSVGIEHSSEVKLPNLTLLKI